jgi:GntR family transcriptional regulator
MEDINFHNGNIDPLTRLSGGPLHLYYQVANLIRSGIMEGTWPPGSRLPTEHELAKALNVSRPTIRSAKDSLAEEGLIKSIKGSGSYVNNQNKWKNPPPTVENLNDIFHYGKRLSFRIHEYGMVTNRRDIIDRLKNHQDRFVFQIKGTRWDKDKPISSVIYYIPFKYGSRIPLEKLDGNPFIPQLEKLAGIKVVEGIQNISLEQANSVVAKELGIKKGQVVIMVRTVYYDDHHQPIEYVETQYLDRLPYSIRVKRD